jgi:MFS transporter, putative metabolite:H+ symporter
MSIELDYPPTTATEYLEEQKPHKVLTDYFDSVEINLKQKVMIALLGFGLFFDSMDAMNFSLVAPVLVKNWNLSLAQVGQINFIFFIGMFIGGLLGGYISNLKGRKKTILASILLFSVSSILNGFANGFLSFLLLRLFTGIGAASLVVVTNLYLIEMLPSKNRGKWQALVFACGTIAIPVASILNKSVSSLGPDSWRILYFVGGAGIISFVLGLVWLKESPRWLVSKGKIAEAEKIVEEITDIPADLSHQNNESSKAIPVFDTFKQLFAKNNRRNTWVLISIFWLAYPAYLLIPNWLPVLFSQKGFSIQDTATFSIFLACGLSTAPFLAVLISDLGGRKWTIVVLYSITIVLSFIYGHLETKYIVFVFVALMALFAQATNPITLTYLAELYPTNLRSTAVGFIFSFGRLFIAIVQLLIASIVERYGQVGVFNFMAISFIAPTIFLAIWGIRTSGRSLEDLQVK